MIVRRWDDKDGELCETSVRRLFNREVFYIARHVFPSSTEFVGRMRAGTVFVLRGTCWLWSESGGSGTLTRGDIVDVGAGDYGFRASAQEEVEIVKVWDLRPRMN